METIQAMINQLRTDTITTYGYTIFEVTPFLHPDRLQLRGTVLLESQKRQLFQALESKITLPVEDQLRVAANPADRTEIGWGFSTVPALPVFRYFPPSRSKRDLNTQIVYPTDPIRILAEAEGWLLVQLLDRTLGWIKSTPVNRVLGDDFHPVWEAVIRAKPDRLVPVKRDQICKLKQAASQFLGVKYLWGGASFAGIDCSGFVQRAFREAWEIILPKNSWDQRRCGVSVPLEHAQAGDLLFLMGEYHHVALFFSEDEVMHASLNRKNVVTEPLETVLKSYQFEALRRIIKVTP